MAEDTEESQGSSYEDKARDAPKESKPAKQKPGGPPDGPDPDAWMVTFSDLLTLLMTFFVLIFASQDPIEEKFFEAFGQSSGVFSMFRTSFFQDIAVLARQDISQDRIQIFLDDVGAVDIEVKQEERGLVITLPSDTFFDSGSAKLNRKALKRLAVLMKILQRTRHPIRVEGHSDNREAKGGKYPSGWELSVARAHSVLLNIERSGGISADRLSLTGYGPTRPRFGNQSASGRKRNRRVEIVILNRSQGS